MGKEFELKYAAEEAAFDGLLTESGDWTRFEMATTYYDTPDAKLGKRYWTLRRRFENGVSICTVKTPSDDPNSRSEYEVACDDILEAIPQLHRLGAPAELMAIVAMDGIREVCAARFTRMAGKVVLEDAEVELALDKGELLGGGKALPFVEVEVELNSGTQAAAVAYAEALAEKYGLRPEPKSKYKRALQLAGKS